MSIVRYQITILTLIAIQFMAAFVCELVMSTFDYITAKIMAKKLEQMRKEKCNEDHQEHHVFNVMGSLNQSVVGGTNSNAIFSDRQSKH